TLQKWGGSSWSTTAVAALGYGTYNSMVIDSSGNLYLAYRDRGNGSRLTVHKWTNSISTWSVVGSAGFSAAAVTYNSLVRDGGSGNLYVAYSAGQVFAQSFNVPVVPLPLHLLQFEAKANTDCGVDIRWTTASEKDINRFVVQGSSNASDWEDKAVVQPSKNASGQHQYQYQDLLDQSGTYYYRLMYEENDGTKMYSPVSALRLSCATNSPKLYPTMTQDKVTIWLPESYADAQIMVLNLNGQHQYVEQESNGAYRVLHLAALAQGLYFVRIVQNNGNTVHFKVIKQ
ncbi:MAG: T9SS type A sorting domain-containing protein, partial [Phycisphaerales bacterium]|nr:T9SS type A sorting domain-containing protein [Phycisphaerales bacterium]